jgi:hypothetical protein
MSTRIHQVLHPVLAFRTHTVRAHAVVVDAALRREIAEHRLNRFLHVHLTLCAVIGLLPLFTPDAAERSAPAWVLQGVLYCLSLSSLLLGLSAAHGDSDEFPLLFTQPIGHGAWLTGKLAALVAMLAPASALTILPVVLTTGPTTGLFAVGAAAAGVCVVMALIGLTTGLWVRDHVRGLLLALGVWFLLLFGVDLALLALSGSVVVQDYSSVWVLPLMLNPLSALRVTMLFTLEGTAPVSVGTGQLVAWWLGHSGLWLAVMLCAWAAALFAAALAGARRRLDV